MQLTIPNMTMYLELAKIAREINLVIEDSAKFYLCVDEDGFPYVAWDYFPDDKAHLIK